jgi:hypothetical protein
MSCCCLRRSQSCHNGQHQRLEDTERLFPCALWVLIAKSIGAELTGVILLAAAGFAVDLVMLAVPLALPASHLQRKDLPMLAVLTSAPLSQIVYFAHAAALLALPTLAPSHASIAKVAKAPGQCKEVSWSVCTARLRSPSLASPFGPKRSR